MRGRRPFCRTVGPLGAALAANFATFGSFNPLTTIAAFMTLTTGTLFTIARTTVLARFTFHGFGIASGMLGSP